MSQDRLLPNWDLQGAGDSPRAHEERDSDRPVPPRAGRT